MKIKLNQIALVRGHGFCESPEKLHIKGSKEIQVSQLLGASQVKVTDKGNLKTTVTFNTVRQHPTTEDAASYVLEHAAEIASEHGLLSIALEDEGNTEFALYDATVRLVDSFPDGVLSHHKYEIVGGKFESKPNELL